jgi:hypothetical protein
MGYWFNTTNSFRKNGFIVDYDYNHITVLEEFKSNFMIC